MSTTEPFNTHITAVSILICSYGLVFTQSTLRRKDTYLINVNKNDYQILIVTINNQKKEKMFISNNYNTEFSDLSSLCTWMLKRSSACYKELNYAIIDCSRWRIVQAGAWTTPGMYGVTFPWSDPKLYRNQNIHFILNFSLKSCHVWDMRKGRVQSERPHMTIKCGIETMPFARKVTKAGTHIFITMNNNSFKTDYSCLMS
jgi:hypothetical protein